MDPVTAFQVSCGVIQLVGLGVKVVSTCKEISENASSLSPTNNELSHDAYSLNAMTQRLSEQLRTATSVQGLTKDELQLKGNADESLEATKELQELLDSLKIKDQKSKRYVLRKAVKGVWLQKKIDEVQNRMTRCQQRLNTGILMDIHARDTLSEVQLREIQETVDLSALQHSQAMLQVDSRFQSLVNEISDIRLSVTRSRSQTRKMIQESQSLNLKDKRFDLLVDSLKFKMINAREEEIRDAHASTFNWIFDPSGKPLSGIIQSSRFGKSRWDNFVEWLEYGTGIYWINGKAGSGKSTLMKYIRNDDRFIEHLKIWARDKRVIIGSFYFWRAGSLEHRTLCGLLRSLMLQMIKTVPDLAEPLLAQTDAEISFWSEQRLIQIMKTLIELSSGKASICLLVDGLDEFDADEDPSVLIDLVTSFIDGINGNIKLCVSSRPELAFIEALSSCPTLRLQDLTLGDMRKFALIQFRHASYFKRLEQENICKIDELVEHVCAKSDGVFLWAALAVKDLMKGLRGHDSMEVLFERLEGLEPTLEGIFTRSIDSIDNVYRTSAARFLRLVMLQTKIGAQSLTLLHFAFMEHSDKAQVLAHFDPSGPQVKHENHSFAAAQILNDLKIALITRCAGLLDVNESCSLDERCFPVESKKPLNEALSVANLCKHYERHTSVQLIHRSALDFLNEDPRAERLFRSYHIADEQAYQSLAMASLGLLDSIYKRMWIMKTSGRTTRFFRKVPAERDHVRDLVKILTAWRHLQISTDLKMKGFANVEKATCQPMRKARFVLEVYGAAPNYMGPYRFIELINVLQKTDVSPEYAFCRFVIMSGFNEYLMKKLECCSASGNQSFFNFLLREVIAYQVCFKETLQYWAETRRIIFEYKELVRKLLHCKANPNAEAWISTSLDNGRDKFCSEPTIWQCLLGFACRCGESHHKPLWELINMFLHGGADPATIAYGDSKSFVLTRNGYQFRWTIQLRETYLYFVRKWMKPSVETGCAPLDLELVCRTSSPLRHSSTATVEIILLSPYKRGRGHHKYEERNHSRCLHHLSNEQSRPFLALWEDSFDSNEEDDVTFIAEDEVIGRAEELWRQYVLEPYLLFRYPTDIEEEDCTEDEFDEKVMGRPDENNYAHEERDLEGAAPRNPPKSVPYSINYFGYSARESV